MLYVFICYKIFKKKINALKNKQKYKEKILKKSDQIKKKKKNIFSNKNVFKKDV